MYEEGRRRTLTLDSLLQHGEAVGDLGLQLVDLERSADRKTETMFTGQQQRPDGCLHGAGPRVRPVTRTEHRPSAGGLRTTTAPPPVVVVPPAPAAPAAGFTWSEHGALRSGSPTDLTSAVYVIILSPPCFISCYTTSYDI